MKEHWRELDVAHWGKIYFKVALDSFQRVTLKQFDGEVIESFKHD